ncbi:MAG: choice-of-anchor D domain-containing protein, partial [Planctomycetaceae bacterium]|nr:choice-of-anchor D domain-containing protein [Planctomycetaceae bacterium]
MSRDRHAPRTRRLAIDRLEARHMLSSDGAFALYSGPLLDNFTLSQIKNGGLLAGQQALYELQRDYQTFKAQDSVGAFQSDWSRTYAVHDGAVDLYVQATGDAGQLSNLLTAQGWTVGTIAPDSNVVTVTSPLDRLAALAALPEVRALRPIDRAIGNARGVGNNQGVETMRVDTFQQTPNRTGAGQIVGVLSDSVSVVGGGLASSVQSGDLPAGVRVLLEGPSGANDEGRGMLELIHDIAPGAGLAFASATINGQAGFAQSIDALRTMAGATVLVDDIVYFLEPQFQPGVIDQAIERAVNANVPYFSAVGNTASDGYESPLRFVTSGSSQLQDWDPGAGVDTTLRITVAAGDDLYFQWDNPYDGVMAQVTADIDVEIRDTNGNLIDSGVSNNLAPSGIPAEVVTIPRAGTYDITVRYFAGSAVPTRVKFYSFFGLGLNSVEYVASDQYQTGSAGHGSGVNAISVGAVAFNDAPPYGVGTIVTESFSSTGPQTQIFDSRGNRLVEPIVAQKPDIVAIDGVNTSFFGRDSGADADSLPNFSGTSAAAPNAAAVAALLKQAFPGTTVSQLKGALMSSARPVNGTPAGQWDASGGFGLIDIVAAASRLSSVFAPEIDVSIDGHSITSGDLTPSAVDGTDFGAAGLNFGQVSRTIVITNTGTGPLLLTGSPAVQVTGLLPGEFSLVVPPSITSIPAGGSTQFILSFTPLLPGSRRATIAIPSNDVNELNYSFSIAGTGSTTEMAPEVSVTGNGQAIYDGDGVSSTGDGTDFGATDVGRTITRTFTIQNLGNSVLNLGGNPRVLIDGPQAASFAVVQQPGTPTLAPGASTTFRIAFTPVALGTARAVVHIFTNDLSETSFDFAIDGRVNVPGVFGGIWHDIDRDGIYDVGEPLANGLRVFLDKNNNRVVDGDEPLVRASNGGFAFFNVTPGAYNVVFEVITPYYVVTPLSGYLPITYQGGALVAGSFGVRVNSAPVLDNSVPLQILADENNVTSTGTGVLNLLATGAGGDPVSDPDVLNSRGIAIVGADTSHGSWQFSVDGGINWNGIGAVSASSARLLTANALTRIRFQPLQEFSGTITNGLTIRAWDGTQGSAGDLFAVADVGGYQPFSANTVGVTLNVRPVNDAPTVSAPGSQGGRPDVEITFSAANSSLITVDDIDAPDLRVTLLASHGTLRLTNSANLTSITGELSNRIIMTGLNSALNAALAEVVFIPESGFSGDASLTVIATDAGINGSPLLSGTAVIPISLRAPFSLEGTTLFVTGSAAADTAIVQYIAGDRVSVTLNGVTQVHQRGDVPQVTIALGGGGDTSVVHGGAEVETALLAPQSVTLTAAGRQLTIGGATKNYVFGSGNDIAVLQDSTGGDQFIGLPTTSIFQSAHFTNQVVGFGKTYVYASYGVDNSAMYDSAGVDNFYAFEEFAALTGNGFLIQVFGFDTQWAISNYGNDYAQFRDSAGDDTVITSPTQVTLTTAGRRLAVAYGFDRTAVIAT